MPSRTIQPTDDGGIEFRITDENGDTRGYRMRHDSNGKLVIGHSPPGQDAWEELVPEQASGSNPTN